MIDPIFSAVIIFGTVILVGCVSVFVYDCLERVFTGLVIFKPSALASPNRSFKKVTTFYQLARRTYMNSNSVPVGSYARSNRLVSRAGGN